MTSWTVVASSGPLSSRHRPVNRGKRIANPAPFRTRSRPPVWTGLRGNSAPSTSRTTAGSNHASGSSFESTRAGCCRTRGDPRRSGSDARVAPSKPDPSLHTVRNTSASLSYAAMRRAPYVPARFPRPANAPTTTRSTASDIAAAYSRLNLIHWYPRAPVVLPDPLVEPRPAILVAPAREVLPAVEEAVEQEQGDGVLLHHHLDVVLPPPATGDLLEREELARVRAP